MAAIGTLVKIELMSVSFDGKDHLFDAGTASLPAPMVHAYWAKRAVCWVKAHVQERHGVEVYDRAIITTEQRGREIERKGGFR